MIWLWIVLALIISSMALIKKEVPLPLYMWLLLPIDAYGLTIGSTIVKPYMIFALILPIAQYAKDRSKSYDLFTSKGQLFAGIIACLMVTVNIFNSQSSYSAKAATIALIVYICAQITASTTDKDNIDTLSDVFIASSFGFGLVFIFGYILIQSGVNIDGIIAQTREAEGMYMLQNNMSNGSLVQVYRLRGFTYDPNTMFIQFCFGLAACILRILKKPSIMNICCAVICIISIILSSSRMGLICCVMCFVISCIVGIGSFKSSRKKALTIVGVLLTASVVIMLFATDTGDRIISQFISSYSNRSGLTDDYGRFTIWGQSIKAFWEMNPLFGVGFGNMTKLTQIHLMSHNTWLELLCECGIIIGGITIFYFLCIAIVGWFKSKNYSENNSDSTSYFSILIGYTVTLVALSSVDNFTCSYLWFAALMVLKLSSTADNKPHTKALISVGYDEEI